VSQRELKFALRYVCGFDHDFDQKWELKFTVGGTGVTPGLEVKRMAKMRTMNTLG